MLNPARQRFFANLSIVLGSLTTAQAALDGVELQHKALDAQNAPGPGGDVYNADLIADPLDDLRATIDTALEGANELLALFPTSEEHP